MSDKLFSLSPGFPKPKLAGHQTDPLPTKETGLHDRFAEWQHGAR
jgi:hypothetical protein